MPDSRPISQEQAIRAQETLTKRISFEDIFGPLDPVSGQNFRKSMGITADPPDYQDHYIQVVAPVSTDVSRIPSEIDGVRIVIVHEDLPGFYAP